MWSDGVISHTRAVSHEFGANNTHPYKLVICCKVHPFVTPNILYTKRVFINLSFSAWSVSPDNRNCNSLRHFHTGY